MCASAHVHMLVFNGPKKKHHKIGESGRDQWRSCCNLAQANNTLKIWLYIVKTL